MKKFNTLRLDLAEKTLTHAEKKKREEIAMAMERENPGMPMAKKMAIATAAAKKVAEENLDELNKDTVYSYATKAEKDVDKKHKELTSQIKTNNPLSADKTASKIQKRYTGMDRAENRLNKEDVAHIDELKSSTLTSYIDKVATGPSRGNKNIKAIGGVTTAIRKRAENENPPFEPNVPTGERKDQFGNPIKNVAKHLAKQGMKSVTEEIETTHEDPLVVTKDSDGNIHTHANLSVANAIHGTDVKHQAIHTGMPVQAGKFTFELSKHHASAVKEAKEKTEYDYEGDMARGQLQSIIMNAQRVHDMLKDNDNLPEWVQSKITLAEDYISTVSNYMSSEIDEDKDPCWDNYKQFGMKKGKNGKPVPDCRGPVKEDSIDELTLSFGKPAKPTVSARISDMKKYFDNADKDQIKQKITGKKFHDMSEYETWMKSNKSKGAMQVASFEQSYENKLDEISSNTLHSYMKAAHTKYSKIEYKNDPASTTKKEKIDKGVKKAYKKMYPPKKSEPENKVDMSSASSYYASKKPGQYTGD